MNASPGLSRYGPLLAGVVAMLVVLLIPLSVIALLDEAEPELRVAAAGGLPSVLIADGDDRLLVINTDDRETARAVSGRLYRPWESKPSILIAPSEDGAAIGLWEMLQRAEPASLVVAGVPGADPMWDAIERDCRKRGIDLIYVSGHATVNTDRLLITVLAPGPETGGDRVVIVQRGEARAVIALESALPAEPGNVLITGASGEGASADVVITSDSSSRSTEVYEVVVDPREVVRMSLEPSTMRVSGGSVRVPVVGGAR